MMLTVMQQVLTRGWCLHLSFTTASFSVSRCLCCSPKQQREVGMHVQVFAKGAKFSMFKPAEEMVYIGLDEESRTKGKAAIDVVGAQSGKSAGSVLQQVR